MPNSFKNAAIAATTVKTTFYTAPVGGTAVVQSIFISNVDGAASADVDLILYDSSALTEFHIGKSLPVGPDSTMIIEKTINLEAEDELRITASVNGDIEAVASVLEIT